MKDWFKTSTQEKVWRKHCTICGESFDNWLKEKSYLFPIEMSCSEEIPYNSKIRTLIEDKKMIHLYDNEIVINLSNYVKAEWKTGFSHVSISDLKNDLAEMIIYLSDNIQNNYSLEINIMGYAEMLLKLGIKYGSKKSLTWIKNISFAIINSAYNTSANYQLDNEGLLREFDFYGNDHFDFNLSQSNKGLVLRSGIIHTFEFNCLAPNYIAEIFGVTNGIQPISHFHYTVSIKDLNKEVLNYNVFIPILDEYLDLHDETDKDKLPSYFVTADRINYEETTATISAWSKHLTEPLNLEKINNEFSLDEISDLYLQLKDKDLSGFSITY